MPSRGRRGRWLKKVKKDLNHREIVDALRGIGVIVHEVESEGSPDLLTFSRSPVPRPRGWLPIEIKSPTGKLTPKQAALHQRAPFPIVYGIGEALALFGVETYRRLNPV